MKPRARTAALAVLVALLLAGAVSCVLGGTRHRQESVASRRAVGAIQPRVSPDGRSIAFSYQGAIWRMPREGGEMRRLTSGPGFDVQPAWSPDGKRIAYVNASLEKIQVVDIATGALRLIDARTGDPLALPRPVMAMGKIYFHPDGKRLLGSFSEGEDVKEVNLAGRMKLGWIDLESGRVQVVSPSAQPWFCLSPDGHRIAYATSQDVQEEQGGNDGPQADLWIASAGGGEPRKLVTFPARIFDLWWGGSDLYLVSNLGSLAHHDLWKISPEDPSHAHQLTSGQADEGAPSISGDGRWLVYTDNRENATAIVVRDLETGDDRVASVSGLDYGIPTGTLRIRIVEKGTGRPLTASVSLQQREGKAFAPVGSLYHLTLPLPAHRPHFYCEKEAVLTVPAGRLLLNVTRGMEYHAFEREVEVSPRQESVVTVELQRWSNPAARSWYGGETHIHANYGYGHWYNTPETIKRWMEGEGLHVANLMVANPDDDSVYDRQFFRGRPDPLSTPQHILYWNEEFRATLWGHMNLLNLKYLVEPIFTGFKDTTNPWDVPTNADIADHTHLQGGLVNYTHPARNVQDPYLGAYTAKAMPVDVALGKIDSVDVSGTWYEPTLGLWYRLLSCGFRLPSAAGTDCFLNRIACRLPGGSRVYVKIDGPFTYEAWIRGLREGRSFVTNGPLVEFTVNGLSVGDTLRLDAPGSVEMFGAAASASPLERVELVYNGEVMHTGTLSGDRLTGRMDRQIRLERSGWLSFRTQGVGGKRAHTNPIYVDVGGKPVSSRKDAEFFLEWIDRLEAKLKERGRLPSPDLKAHVDRQFEAARAVYRRLADEGEPSGAR